LHSSAIDRLTAQTTRVADELARRIPANQRRASSPATRGLTVALALLLGIALLGGCQTARVAHPLTENLAGNDVDSQMDFWHTLADRHVTSNDEAFHGMLLFIDGNDPSTSYPQRVALLKSRNWLPADFNEPADQAVERGPLAYVIVQSLSIKGGWVMHVFGPSERYAVRELEDMGLYTLSSPNQTFSGSEFLGIIGKLEDYQQASAKTVAEAH
jgi:hypothetical protein